MRPSRRSCSFVLAPQRGSVTSGRRRRCLALSNAPVRTGREGPAGTQSGGSWPPSVGNEPGRADLLVGLDARQRVPTGFMAPAAAFDKAVEEFMKERNVPGGALAVARNGKLVYARGYGWAVREAKAAA